MQEEKIHARFKLLHELLELPDADRYVGNCSGGQKRRVSFAAAMVHEPELLILDEPTVGLDPMLREKIWNFLIDSTRSSKLAVIITTHYIEEATLANRIGMMRNGILLAEDSPKNIMATLNRTSLEDAFLELCVRQGNSEEADATFTRADSIRRRLPQGQPDPEEIKGFPKKIPVARNQSFQETKVSGLKGSCQITTKKRMKALMTKNILQMVRQPG